LKENSGPSTRDRGQVAENLAADFLRSKGYRIVDRNFLCRFGEIDIVARDGEELVFVEVRSRKTAQSLDPIYSVNWRKQQKVIKAAQIYLSQRPTYAPIPSRFDVVIVTLGPQPDVVLVKDAFQTDGLSDHGI
jgi:putative endonuclease